jgi:outer membrane protein, heavy metal efflux system
LSLPLQNRDVDCSGQVTIANDQIQRLNPTTFLVGIAARALLHTNFFLFFAQNFLLFAFVMFGLPSFNSFLNSRNLSRFSLATTDTFCIGFAEGERMRRLPLLCRWFRVGMLGLTTGCASWQNERENALVGPANQEHEVRWESSSCPNVSLKQDVSESDRDLQSSIANCKLNEQAHTLSVDTDQRDRANVPAKTREPFRLPSGLPGADAAPIQAPSLKGLSPSERERKIREAYPALTPLPDVPPPGLPESGKPYTLAELQAFALDKNPTIKRAAAEADAAYGAMVQAGLYPNPHVGYQADQIQPGPLPKNNAGQQGAFIQQLIKTAGKLSLATAAAGMNYANAQVALRRARLDVINQVRSHYYAVLVARETMHVSGTLAKLADELYDLQLRYVASGEAAGHEPLQLYAQAVQARNVYALAASRYAADWKQLAASLGMPELPLRALDGTVDAPPPRYDAELARQRVLERHTDLLSAQNSILQAQYQARLARVTPIPDVSINTAFQHDNAVGNNQANVQIGITLPLFDRNQGNIQAALALLARSQEDLQARQNDLSARLAEALGRYQSSQAIVQNYREHILPNLSRAHRAIIQRRETEPDKVQFNDIVVSQNNLGQALNSYLIAIGDQWTAVVDLANLLQIDDLYAPIGEENK